MRNLVLALSLGLSINAFAQKESYTTEYEIRYELDYKYYVEETDRRQESMYLYTGNEASVFMNHNTAKKKEIQERMQEMLRSGNINMNEAGYVDSKFDIKFYKDYLENKVWKVMDIADQDYAYQEEAAPLTWEISNETKTYEEYEVQKATTSFAGRDYIAWFTMEIPIADGPYVFSGLPGLIVELYDTEEHYKFSLLSVEKLEEPREWNWTVKKNRLLSKKKVNDTKEKYLKTKANTKVSFNQGGGQMIVKVEGREVSETEYNRMRREKAARLVNHIELK